jgi:hypothetical protein
MDIKKIFYFLAVAIAGYLITIFLTPIALHFHWLPNVVTAADTKMAQQWIFAGGFIAYILGLLTALGSFFAKSRLRYGLLLAAIYVPLFYEIVIIARLDALFGLAPVT